MEYTQIPGTDLKVSRISLGTWAMGGWMWGGTDEEQAIKTIHTAIDKGINLIDTAPVYGFGRSEQIVGRALALKKYREQVCISTKTGLGWQDERVGELSDYSAAYPVSLLVHVSLLELICYCSAVRVFGFLSYSDWLGRSGIYLLQNYGAFCLLRFPQCKPLVFLLM